MPQIGQAWVEIGARTEQFERAIQKTVTLLDQFGRPLQRVQAELPRVGDAANKAGAAFRNFSNAGGAASVTAIGFSQGIQDIPYGLRGVVNNVQFTAQSFTQLVATTGSARAAFAALASSLAGPVGILVAFSAATVALQLWSESAGEAEGSTSKLTEALGEAITLAGEGIRIEVDASQIEPALDSINATIEAFDRTQATLTQARNLAGVLTLGVPDAPNVQRDALDAALKTLQADNETNKAVRERLEALRIEAITRERIADAAERLGIGGRGGAARRGAVPPRPGPVISLPEGFREDVSLEEMARREFASLSTDERVRASQAAGLGPGIPGPVIDLSAFENLEQTTGRLVADMERLSVDAVIPTQTAFQNLARESVKDFAFELGDAAANLVLFGDSLKETLGNIGKRAAGSFLGGIINFGVGSLLDEIPGFSTAKNAAGALSGASGRPDTSGVAGLSARISLTDIVIEQQRAATRNNLNLLGLS